jgi:hypothetical protein
MATARNTISTIFDTVGTAANVATKSLNAVSVGVGMANAFVNRAAAEQEEQYKLDAKVSTINKLRDAAREEAEMQHALRAYKAKSPQHADDYDAAYAMFSAVLAPKLDNVRSFGQAAE